MLEAAADGNGWIGEVRGRGAMLAVEFVVPGTKDPAPDAAAAVMAACHRQGVVTLQCGTYGNVIRLLPPLVMSDELLLDGLAVLTDACRPATDGRDREMTTYANSEPPTGATESSYAEVQAAVAAAAAAAPVLAATPSCRPGGLAGGARAHRGAAYRRIGRHRGPGDRFLGRARLDGEVARCATQLRFYARVCADGAWLGATIDHAAGAAPDLRRMNIPLGPVAVFGASNFPFGFGTLGNGTGSALAAGCPVVVKGHPAHPRTHARLAELAGEALGDAGGAPGSFGAVTGMAAGQQLVLAEALGAVAFTGSEAGGMALHRLATTRPVPIPVYAEMGTVNAVVLTQAAAAEAAAVREIAAGRSGRSPSDSGSSARSRA